MIWSMLIGLVTAIPGLAGKFIDLQAKKADADLQGFTTAAGVDHQGYKAYLDAQVETNRMKMAQNSWWGAKFIILMAGVPASMHFASVMLDSLPFPYMAFSIWYVLPYPYFGTHVVGSWGIPKLPTPYDTYQWAIVQSFFLVMPVQTAVGAVAQWLNRRR